MSGSVETITNVLTVLNFIDRMATIINGARQMAANIQDNYDDAPATVRALMPYVIGAALTYVLLIYEEVEFPILMPEQALVYLIPFIILIFTIANLVCHYLWELER